MGRPERSNGSSASPSRGPAGDYRSGDALFVYDESLTVLSWNEAAEQLTGIPADAAVGHRCWDVLRGVSERGDVVCHPGCSGARLAREGWPKACSRMLVQTPKGRKLISVSTVTVHHDGQRPVVLNLLRNGYGVEATKKAASRLTPRQVDILQRLAVGKVVRTIAAELGISETTARNHVAAILRRLDCHSQLEAVAEARRLELI